MDVRITSPDNYANDAYRNLFNVIMADIGKAQMMESVEMVLKPEIPLFIFSVRLVSVPESMRLKDAASVRTEGETVHITISDERYAPSILAQLWKRYGRDNVDQSTRFDISVLNADSDDVSEIGITSGETVLKDVIGAVWRAMPEGIKARHSFTDGNTVTVMATEEIVKQEMRDEAFAVHKRMTEGA